MCGGRNANDVEFVCVAMAYLNWELNAETQRGKAATKGEWPQKGAKGLLTSAIRPACRAGRTTDFTDDTDEEWRRSARVQPSSFVSKPSVKSVVKTIFESSTAIELARAAIRWEEDWLWP